MAKELPQTEKNIRVHMLQSKTIPLGENASIHYRSGQFYLLSESEAKKWVQEGIAELEEATKNG